MTIVCLAFVSSFQENEILRLLVLISFLIYFCHPAVWHLQISLLPLGKQASKRLFPELMAVEFLGLMDKSVVQSLCCLPKRPAASHQQFPDLCFAPDLDPFSISLIQMDDHNEYIPYVCKNISAFSMVRK